MGALALSLAAVPAPQASAAGHTKFSVGFNLCFEHYGNQQWCGHGCFRQNGHDQRYVVVMPGQEHAQPRPGPQWQQAPPPGPDRRPGDRKPEETSLQWGYPSLGYSYYHPVSYYQAQPQPSEAPTYYYYAPQSNYPAYYGAPNYYQTPGVTFDR